MTQLLTIAEAAEQMTLNGKRPRRRGMPLVSRSHSEIIEMIVSGNHGAVSKNFHKTAWLLLRDDLQDEFFDDGGIRYSGFRKIMLLIPDAYSIDLWRRRMTLFEVEITSRLTADKLYRFGSFALDLAMIGWILTLIRVDEFGRMRKEALERFVGAP